MFRSLEGILPSRNKKQPVGSTTAVVEQGKDGGTVNEPKDATEKKKIVPVDVPRVAARVDRMVVLNQRSSKDKVEGLVFHPIDSKVAMFDRGGKVVVWDYEADEILYTNQFGGSDEGAMQELLLRKKAEAHSEIINSDVMDTDVSWKAKNDVQYQMLGISSGKVNDVAFLDRHTCLWQQGNQESLGGNCFESCAGIFELLQDESIELLKHCWLVVSSENKVSLHDLSSSRSMIFPRSSFESQKPTKVAVLVYNSMNLIKRQAGASPAHQRHTVSPVIAVGTQSGSIYLLQLHSGEVVAKCSGAHTKAVTCLKVIGPSHPGGPDRLVSGSADGTIAVWDPSRSPKSFDKASSASLQPITCIKAHEGDVFDLDVFGLQGIDKNGNLVLRPYLSSVGADRQMYTWNTNSWTREYMPLQVLPKDSLVSIGSTMRAGLGLGSTMPLVGVSDKSCAIFGLDPKESKSQVLIDMEFLIDKGDKKRPKIYSMAVNPSTPSIVGLATNTGVVILQDSTSTVIPSSISLLSQSLFVDFFLALEEKKEMPKTEEQQQEEEEEKEPIKIPQGFTSINAVDNKLLCSLYTMEPDKGVDAKSKTMRLENVGSLELASLDFPIQEDTRIEVSPSGKFISIVWPKICKYSVYGYTKYKHGMRICNLIDSGDGNELVWSTTAPIYAVLLSTQEEQLLPPPLPKAESEVTAIPGFNMTYVDESIADKAEDEKDPVPDETMEDKEPPAYEDVLESKSSGYVRVHAIEDSDDPHHIGHSDISLGAAKPVKIHGGSLLGISASDPSSLKASMRFFSWVDFSPVGSNIPSPNWISWDPESTMCALGYDTAIQLCAVYPQFHCFATLAIHGAESAFWQIRQLYISTPTSINVVYTDSREAYVEEICLADFSGQSKETTTMKQGYAFGQRRLRPSGPVRLAGIKHSYIVVHDSLERPFLISLRNYGLRARSLAAKGDIDTAVALTAKHVRPVLHDGTAQCILAMGSEVDYEKVLTLPGLSPEMKISISIRNGDWNRAARAFQAHSLGVNDTVYSTLIKEDAMILSPSAILNAPDTIGERNMATVSNILEESAAAENHLRVSDEQAEKESDRSSDTQSSDDTDAEEEYIDPIDWNSWKEMKSVEDARARIDDGISKGGAVISDEAEMLRILDSVDMGLELSSAALEPHKESARQILGTLLAYAMMLPKDRLQKLVDQMAMMNMTESLRNLWSVTHSAKSNGQSISVATLLAASVGEIQDTSMVESLMDVGLYPLAFLYASVWGQGNPDKIEELWKEHIH